MNKNTLESKFGLEVTRNRNRFFASSDKRASPTAVGSSRPPFPRDDQLVTITSDRSPFDTYEFALFHKKRPDISVSFYRVR